MRARNESRELEWTTYLNNKDQNRPGFLTTPAPYISLFFGVLSLKNALCKKLQKVCMFYSGNIAARACTLYSVGGCIAWAVGLFFAITYYVSWYRLMVIFITVYRQYTQFVVSTTYYHILPAHIIYIITRGHYIARKRSLHIPRYSVQLYIISPRFCTLHRSFFLLCPIHALFVHVLATFVHVLLVHQRI